MAQLLMVDVGLGAIAAALGLLSATDGIGTLLGAIALVILGAALVLGSVIRIRGRWAYQHLLAWARLRRSGRRMRITPTDPAAPAPAPLFALTGGYAIETIPGPRQSSLGAVSCGTAWTVALEVMADDLLNDDPGLPLGDLPSLLTIEGVTLAQVRVLTLAAPAHAGQPGEPAALPRSAARICLLTLDTRTAADALNARGGSMAALAQILRRCVLRAEEMLASHGLASRPVDAPAMTRLLDASLGLHALAAGDAQPHERWAHVSFGAGQAVSVALGGDASRGLAVADELLATLPGAVTASAVIVSGSSAEPLTTLLVRASTLDAGGTDIAARIEGAAHARGLRVDALRGRQRDALLLTVPLVVGS
jgi:type VII secretion protein EccE